LNIKHSEKEIKRRKKDIGFAWNKRKRVFLHTKKDPSHDASLLKIEN